MRKTELETSSEDENTEEVTTENQTELQSTSEINTINNENENSNSTNENTDQTRRNEISRSERNKKILNTIGKNKKKIQKFYVKPSHQRYVTLLDMVLRESIYNIELSKVSQISKRRNIKKSI